MKAIAAIILVLCMHSNNVNMAPMNSIVYPSSAVVVSLDYDNDVVTVQDANGFLWSFHGCEDYYENDMVSLIFSNNGTPDSVLDDIIISAKYSGYWMTK